MRETNMLPATQFYLDFLHLLLCLCDDELKTTQHNTKNKNPKISQQKKISFSLLFIGLKREFIEFVFKNKYFQKLIEQIGHFYYRT